MPRRQFDTSGKSPVKFHHRAIRKTQTNLAPAWSSWRRRPHRPRHCCSSCTPCHARIHRSRFVTIAIRSSHGRGSIRPLESDDENQCRLPPEMAFGSSASHRVRTARPIALRGRPHYWQLARQSPAQSACPRRRLSASMSACALPTSNARGWVSTSGLRMSSSCSRVSSFRSSTRS